MLPELSNDMRMSCTDACRKVSIHVERSIRKWKGHFRHTCFNSCYLSAFSSLV